MSAAAVDVDGRGCIAAGIFMGVMGGEVFIVQPGFVQGLVEHAGYTEQQAGLIASAEMAGFALVTVLMTLAARRVNWRAALTAFILLATAGNLLSVGVHDFPTFAAVRFLTGFGCGGIVSLGFASLGLSSRPDRHFGFMVMWSGVYGAVVLLAMPRVFDTAGLDGLLLFFAAFAAVGLAMVPRLPTSGHLHAVPDADAVSLGGTLTALAIAGMFFYFLAQGIVWAYLFRIATDAGVGELQAAYGLTVAQGFGIAGALVPALVGSRFGRAPMLFLAISAGILPLVYFLSGPVNALTYGVAVSLYNFGFNKAHPYLLATMASFDRTGRVVVRAVAAQTLGLAVGPAIGALVIGDGSFTRIHWLGIVTFALAFVAVLLPARAQARLAREQLAATQS